MAAVKAFVVGIFAFIIAAGFALTGHHYGAPDPTSKLVVLGGLFGFGGLGVICFIVGVVKALTHERAPREERQARKAPIRRREPVEDDEPEQVEVESGRTVVLHMRNMDGKAMGFRVRNATDEGVRRHVLKLKSKGYEFIRTVEE